MNRINKQMVDSTLTEKEVEKIAEETAKALGSKFSVTKGSVDNRSFSLDYDGVKYDGGSYLIMYNGDIVNVAIMKAPIYYNYKTKKKYEFGGDFQAGVYAGGGGVGLIGNQKRIDMNKNGKIDAEDFKILRSSMNGAWRNERKHVNHNEDYEVRYAKPRTSRTGYKGKRSFDDGGSIDAFTIRMVRGTSGKPTEVISDPREVKFAGGGNVVLKEKLLKELRSLQRDLNSSRLATYREGDTSKEEQERKQEREVKLARFYEVLNLLNEFGDTKLAYGGGFENKDTWQNLLEDFGFKKGKRKYGLDMYYKRGYIASVDKELRNVNLMFEDDVIYSGYSVQGLMNELENQFGKKNFADGGEFMTNPNFGNFQNNVYANGGGVDYVPVNTKISKKEKDEFLEYIDGFYGKKGIYADDLKGGFSKVELRKAMNTYLKELGSAPTWGYGDSVDRERVRQILQPSYKMFNEGGFMSKLLTRKKDQPKVETTDDDIDLKEDSRIRVKSSTFVSKDKEADWMMKKNSSKEARAYSGGGKTETPTKKGKGNHKMKATTDLARKIRKDGEKWTDAIKRASQQLK